MDLHRAPGSTPGLIVEVQSDLLPYLPTRVVVPLVPRSKGPDPVAHLNPCFDIDGTEHMLLPQYIGIVPVTGLQSPIGNLTAHQDTITRALDRLLTDI
ncbi:MAG: CcdB family protein [Pseudomonadota bacterium]